MNALGYLIRRTAWQFGFKRVKKRWQTASQELQILKEAEDLLGRVAWKDTENVEELTAEYWQLKNIEHKREETTKRMEELEVTTEELEDKRFDILESFEEKTKKLEEERETTAAEIDKQVGEIDEIREDASQIRRKFEGLKVKYRVLKEQEGEANQLRTIQAELRQLKSDFESYKKLTEEKNGSIREIEGQLTKADEAIEAIQEEGARKTKGLSTKIGQNHKEMAECRAQIGAAEREGQEIRAAIGTYLSANVERSPEIRAAVKRHMDVVNRINYLRKSIQYNQRLAKGV